MTITRINTVTGEIESTNEDAPSFPSASPAPDRDLSRPEFAYLLAITGLDDVWDSVQTYAKANDRPLYAILRSQREQQTFRLAVTLEFVAQVAGIVARVAPDVDLSEATIRVAWADVAVKS